MGAMLGDKIVMHAACVNPPVLLDAYVNLHLNPAKLPPNKRPKVIAPSSRSIRGSGLEPRMPCSQQSPARRDTSSFPAHQIARPEVTPRVSASVCFGKALCAFSYAFHVLAARAFVRQHFAGIGTGPRALGRHPSSAKRVDGSTI